MLTQLGERKKERKTLKVIKNSSIRKCQRLMSWNNPNKTIEMSLEIWVINRLLCEDDIF